MWDKTRPRSASLRSSDASNTRIVLRCRLFGQKSEGGETHANGGIERGGLFHQLIHQRTRRDAIREQANVRIAIGTGCAHSVREDCNEIVTRFQAHLIVVAVVEPILRRGDARGVVTGR